MVLLGPPKAAIRPHSSFARTGGAGNNVWYTPEVAATASQFAVRSPPATTVTIGLDNSIPVAVSTPVGASSPLQHIPQEQTLVSTLALQPHSTHSAASTFKQLHGSGSTAKATAKAPIPHFHKQKRATAAGVDADAHAADCICTICSCGRHQCPPTPHAHHYDPSVMSESRAAYAARAPLQQQRAKEPHQAPLPHRPFEAVSTHRADYVAHAGARPASLARLSSHRRSSAAAPFSDTTTHRSEFIALPHAAAQSAAPAHQLTDTLGTGGAAAPDTRQFDTEMRTRFARHPLQARKGRAGQTATSASAPFVGESTHRLDYVPLNAAPAEPVLHSWNYKVNPETRDFATEQREMYYPKQAAHCPAVAVAAQTKAQQGHVKVEKIEGTNRYRRA